ncbi:phosphatidylglycerophosphatase A [Dysgonomonas sp. Marseille-P4677]|uniref:phosphatidylglycerophosphatase A family protein n=1 Tax=Dysgonomonas sp. Marseille-P4677 TaxID=2364790 RepID=UPI0019121F13|nr:phosphatidylglycerophosphatase A [Dysgonomonas sp. Marseille-P4677]MBK5719381.1 phosphatidylglycerophosphatase A [Dysgonomonas sp. Marseille-P4677]
MKQKPLFHIIIASGFGSGFSPYAPGTAGAALATIIWLILSFFISSCPLLLITLGLIVIFTILGVWSSNVLEPAWGKDPSRIVVDEMVGVWIPLLAVDNGNLYYALLAFVLFRLFDIFKPLGIRKMENLKGGWGVMMDDILAGIYSLLILLVLKWLIG